MDDGSSLGRISVFVKVGMADACTGFYYRYSSILPYKVNQGATAARNDQIYVSGSVFRLRYAVTSSVRRLAGSVAESRITGTRYSPSQFSARSR